MRVNDETREVQERAWIQAVQSGDREAFAHLVRRYAGMVKGVVTHRLGNDPEMVEEVAQEIFVKAFIRLNQFEGRSKFSTWLYAIAVHHCQDVWRKRQAHPVVSWDAMTEEERERAAPLAAEEREHEWLRRRVEAAWPKLAAHHREILTLREIEGQSYEAIAEILGCRLGTVESRLFRARRALRTLVERGG